ncbi:beta-L-arabinofuranosidase domain-containing protein [Streptomyces sp. NPDC044780]|uniref:beta-L-arabinofuranosidase domain-containing protein n=1 Tax=unclassified Streptomyces TaxID=2593676 RepID=UPI0033D2CD20
MTESGSVAGPPVSRRRVLAASGAAAAAWAAGPPAPASAATPAEAAPAAAPTTAAPAAAAEAAPARLAAFPLSAVRLLESPFLANMRRTLSYLRFVDPDRLLHTFRLNVGLPSTAEPCGGWEAPDVLLRGHSTGHLLSALAFAHANTGEQTYADKARRIVAALAECQAAAPGAGYRAGYLSAFPERIFDELEAGGKPWAPYYTLHKIMAGLLDQYRLSGNDQALSVVRRMAAWVDSRTAPLDEATMQRLLGVEFGGMNEVLAGLYLVTGDPVHLRTARRFDHKSLYGPLAEGRDELDGRHANTELAKIVGAAEEYRATGDPRYLRIARNFWHIVVRDHSYVIGGNSNQEFFGPPGQIVSRLSEDTCENCNSYNMLKIGRRLFRHDPGTAAYMDHYEWTLYNQMLGEQDPDSDHGFVTYYTGLWAGSRRQPKGGLGSAPGSYSGDYDNFSCDHGTGMETHTKFADTIYFRDEKAGALYVNLFIPSEVTWAERGLRLRQHTGYPDTDTVRLTVTEGGGRLALKVRVPGWLADSGSRPRVLVGGRPVAAKPVPGRYLTLDRHWRTGDTVELTFPRELVWRPAPDNPHIKAVSYGPLVLAGAYGDSGPRTIPGIEPTSVRSVAGRGGPEFTAVAEGAKVPLLPFHRVHHQSYNVYFAVPPSGRRRCEIARFPLAEGDGTTSADALRRFPDARLVGGASWRDGPTGPDGAAVALDGKDGHVALPPGLLTGLTELTVSVRVFLESVANSARVFDLGFHKNTYLFLTPRTGAGKARAAWKIAGMEAEDYVDASTALEPGRWIHLALTIGDGTGVLYVDGAEAGRDDAVISGPLLLGATSRNYLGRSQNPAHPYLHGAVADFRVLGRALSAAEVAALYRADG